MISGYKEQAKKLLVGKWGTVVLVVLIGMIVSSITTDYASVSTNGYVGFSFDLTNVIYIALLPLTIGRMRIYTDITKKKNPDIANMLLGFQDGKYLINLAAIFVRNIFIFFWTLLFIIPGIVKAHAYAMTAYIIQDPDFHENDLSAIETSQELMNGKKADLFMLNLSFLGWYILSIFTFGLLLFYVIPYHTTAMVLFFNDIKKNANIKPLSKDQSSQSLYYE